MSVAIGCLLFLATAFLAIPPVSAEDAAWRPALPGWKYEFPRDHGQHREFKTEWLYFTGNLATTETGRRFGYELTFFRQGIRPPTQRGGAKSKLIINDLPFAHFCISDPEGRQFLFQQRIARGVRGDAGFDGESTKDEPVTKLAWNGPWSVNLKTDGHIELWAANESAGATLKLDLQNALPDWTIHGVDGVSQKAAGEGHASQYYSGVRMRTVGTLNLGGKHFEVTGDSWFDHEWASNQLAPDQAGWDWFGLHLSDGSSLMLYQMRLRQGGADAASSGTYIAPQGKSRHLKQSDYLLTPLDYWTSKSNGARYPIKWRVSIPSLALDFTVQTPLPNQELVFPALTYWEGMVDLQGARDGRRLDGHGYMELTGYAGAISGLSQ